MHHGVWLHLANTVAMKECPPPPPLGAWCGTCHTSKILRHQSCSLGEHGHALVVLRPGSSRDHSTSRGKPCSEAKYWPGSNPQQQPVWENGFCRSNPRGDFSRSLSARGSERPTANTIHRLQVWERARSCHPPPVKQVGNHTSAGTLLVSSNSSFTRAIGATSTGAAKGACTLAGVSTRF